MLSGYIDRTFGVNPAIVVQVDGLREQRYMGYSKAQAVRKYRIENHLCGRKIQWRDYTTKPKSDLYHDLLKYLQVKA